ncbi:MAG: DNA methyltransferase [Meiothermus sp.]|nr:DNA methyltransferase [Meiothermus sp.]
MAAQKAGLGQAEGEIVAALRSLDRRTFQAFAQELGLNPKYLRHDLLAAADLPEVLREALRQGLPLREAHRLHRLLRRGILTPKDLEGRPPRDLAILPHQNIDFPLEAHVWLFPPDPRGREALSPAVAKALVLRYSNPEEWVLDPMAGYGTVVQAARALGRQAWGGDIQPLGSHVEKADIRHLKERFQRKAALLVLHPPTFAAFQEGEGRHLDPEERYGAYVGYLTDLVDLCIPAIRKGGKLALVVSPRKEISPKEAQGGKDFFLAPYERALAEVPSLKPFRYHLAVSRDGHQDWHVFVGEVNEVWT